METSMVDGGAWGRSFVDFSNAARRYGCVEICVLFGDSVSSCELSEFRAWVRRCLGFCESELPASWMYVDGEFIGRRFAWVGISETTVECLRDA